MLKQQLQLFNDIKEEMKMVYLHDMRPWMIGFSGGKDSTLLVQLVMEMLETLAPTQINKRIYVVSSDTGVENPVVREYMHRMSKMIGDRGSKYGIISDIVYPPVDKSFWYCLIGLGYPTPEAPGFRWCTDKLKIKPMNDYTLNRIQENGEIVMLLGVRKAESVYRARGIKNREVIGKLLIRHSDIENAYVYNPLTEIPNDVVWEYLLKGNSKTPWGSDNKYLFQLYQGQTLGEEQSILGEVDKSKIAITGNSRFGCWICTMVTEDKSLKNFIDQGNKELIPLRDFRNWLVEIRNNPIFRDKKRRNGSVYLKDNGELGLGAFSMSGRYIILKKLLQLEEDTGLNLISLEELKQIDVCWENEGDIYRRTLVELYYEIKHKKLPWDHYRTPMFDGETLKTIDEKCRAYDIPIEFISKLIVSINKNKYKTRSNSTSKAFDHILNEGWLHHSNIERMKDKLENENK